MSHRIALLAIAAVAFATATNARAAPTEESSDHATSAGGFIEVPESAKLVGSSVVDEIRSFPELGKGMKTIQKEHLVGVAGVDRLFESERSFDETVAFFDHQLKSGGNRVRERVATPSAVVWSVKRPDGNVANAVVRNTRPTTIELTEVGEASTTMPPR